MDIFGNALSDYFKTGTADVLRLHNSYGETEEMPLDIFFRTEEELPLMEKIALNECRGQVLDIGAGAGSHALILQQQRIDVTTLDNSRAAVQIMQQRGVKKAIHDDFFTYFEGMEDRQIKKYDTLLFLMNGIGITGTLPALTAFLIKARSLIRPGGQLLFDSSDIRYLYDGQPLPANHYYGEVSYQYEYQNEKGPWFNWLYVDPSILSDLAVKTGWAYELLFDDQEDQYLARLTGRN